MAERRTCRISSRGPSRTVMHPLGSDDLVLCSGTIRRAPFDAHRSGCRGRRIPGDLPLLRRIPGGSLLGLERPRPSDIHGRPRDRGGGARRPDGLASRRHRRPELRRIRRRRVPRSARAPSPCSRSAAAGSGTRSALADAASAFASLCDRAADHDLLAHIEYFPQSGIPDLTTAYEIVRAAGRGNGGVMVDSWHHLRGTDAGRFDPGFPGESILAVQLGDVSCGAFCGPGPRNDAPIASSRGRAPGIWRDSSAPCGNGGASRPWR